MYDELIAESVRMPNLKFEQGESRIGTDAVMRNKPGILRNITEDYTIRKIPGSIGLLPT